jgi:hypothetical protein
LLGIIASAKEPERTNQFIMICRDINSDCSSNASISPGIGAMRNLENDGVGARDEL